MEQYEQPGGNVRSRVPSKEYKDNYDAIFRKKEPDSWVCAVDDCHFYNLLGDAVCVNCGAPRP